MSPNPWLLRARASNPSITIAREQAQRVERLADSLPQNDSAEIDALRQLLTKGAQTIQARSNEPDAALNALQDLEEQVQQMSAGDDQLSAALAAIASALAGNQNTQALSDAINTGRPAPGLPGREEPVAGDGQHVAAGQAATGAGAASRLEPSWSAIAEPLDGAVVGR